MSDTQPESKNEKVRAIEKLEVEDDESRQLRMHNVFAQLEKSPSTQTHHGSLNFDFGDRRTYAVDPPSELLSRVKAFLPEIAASNHIISQRAREDPRSVDIENIATDGSYIQMNLGLGVFEQRSGAPQSSSGNLTTAHGNHDVEMQLETDLSPSSGTSDSDSEISDDSDSDASSVDIISSLPTFTVRPIRPLPRRKKTQPQVVVLDDSSVPSTNSASSFPNSANSGD